MIIHFKSGPTESMPERLDVTEAAEKRKQQQAAAPPPNFKKLEPAPQEANR